MLLDAVGWALYGLRRLADWERRFGSGVFISSKTQSGLGLGLGLGFGLGLGLGLGLGPAS